jgi:hypothetical protein
MFVMNEYKGNSHRSKEEASTEVVPVKKVERVANAKTRKKGEVRKLADAFIAEDIKSVKDYVIQDVLIPAAKKAIVEMFDSGINMLVYGESKPKNRSRNDSRVSYTKYYERERDYERGTRTRVRGYDYDDIILDTRREAEEVLDRMQDLIDTYGMVSVADLYDLVGINGSYTDNKYGWTRLRDADVQRVRDGYLLKLPKALPFD